MIGPKCVTRGGRGSEKPKNLRDVIYGWSLSKVSVATSLNSLCYHVHLPKTRAFSLKVSLLRACNYDWVECALNVDEMV